MKRLSAQHWQVEHRGGPFRARGGRGSSRAHARRAVVAAALVCLLGWPGAARGQVGEELLHAQPPNRFNGLTSDTEFLTDFGNPTSQLIADRFRLLRFDPVTVRRVVWWGFYGGLGEHVDPPPPAVETMRVRFYRHQISLPGELLFEETFLNPTREWTGLVVSGSPQRREYRYEVWLTQGFEAQPLTFYWVEVAQIGELDSRFRWETSSGGEYAFQFPIGSPWQLNVGASVAYELWTPEPTSAVLFGLGLIGAVMRRPRVRRLTNGRGPKIFPACSAGRSATASSEN
jgi:hypothetical protein